MVVVSANFLIDAESNLKAAIAGFGSGAAPAASGAAASATPASDPHAAHKASAPSAADPHAAHKN